MKRIIQARITAQPKDFLDPMPQVYVVLEGESNEEFLFEYFPDEISFTERELIGLTVAEAKTLKFQKDKNYLQTEVLGCGA